MTMPIMTMASMNFDVGDDNTSRMIKFAMPNLKKSNCLLRDFVCLHFKGVYAFIIYICVCLH